MEMFNKKVIEERIGPLKKNKSLDVLRDVEIYFLKQRKKYKTDASYDVIAQEVPSFRTLCYTEYASCFIMHPLNLQMRMRQMIDACESDSTEIVDYSSHLINNIESKIANKYKNRLEEFEEYKDVDNLVVLAGSNKLKERVCLNKLKYISDTHRNNVYFKPHPITTHAIIGELKDLFGENRILPREIDLYYFLNKAKKVYTTHVSESAIYSIVLGKEIEPTDVYNKVHQGSFYHINSFLFQHQADGTDGIGWINKTFSDPKSGIINPLVDIDWKNKIDVYLDYIHTERGKFESWYIEDRPAKDDVKPLESNI
jgi:hypothetical protein